MSHTQSVNEVITYVIRAQLRLRLFKDACRNPLRKSAKKSFVHIYDNRDLRMNCSFFEMRIPPLRNKLFTVFDVGLKNVNLKSNKVSIV